MGEPTNGNRRAPRFVVEALPGRLVSSSEVEITNMSFGGLAFRVDRYLHVGEQYTLKLTVGDSISEVRGTVVWCTLTDLERSSSEDGETTAFYSAGMKVEGMLSRGAEDLLRFLDEHKIVEEHRLGGLRVSVEGRARLDLPQDYSVRILSLSGMLIQASQAHHLGEVHAMEIGLGDQGRVSLVGRVASCAEALDRAPRHYDVGVEFVEVPPEARRVLEGFLARLTGAASPSP